MVIQRRSDSYDRRITMTNCPIKDAIEVGSGTFGKVYKLNQDGRVFAVKKFTQPNSDALHITTLREIKALKAIDSKYVLKINRILVNSHIVHLVFPYYQYDLYRLMGTENFALAEIKHIFWQVLKGVESIHSSGYLHRDLKTANILINRCPRRGSPLERSGDMQRRADDQRCPDRRHTCRHGDGDCDAGRDSPDRSKRARIEGRCGQDEEYTGASSEYEACICDFGMARTQGKDMSPGVVTLWYRPPEILLGSSSYSRSADVWSLGCILLEFFYKKPIFRASTDVDELYMIIELCGSINKESFPGCTALPLFNKYKLKEGTRCIVERFSQHSKEAADLADKMLRLDPDERISIQSCLGHPFFTAA